MGAGRQPWRKCGVECAGAVFAAGSARGGTKGARPRRSGECGCAGRPAERYGRSRSPLPGWRGAALGSPRGAEGARVGAARAAVPLTASSRRRGPRGRAVGGGRAGAVFAGPCGAPRRGTRPAGGAERWWNFAEFLEEKGRETGPGCGALPLRDAEGLRARPAPLRAGGAERGVCERLSAWSGMAPGRRARTESPEREGRTDARFVPRPFNPQTVRSTAVWGENAFVSRKSFVFETGELLVIVMNGPVVKASQAGEGKGEMLNGMVFFCLSETQI